MKVVGEVNAVHEKTKPRKLQPGEVAIYRVLCGTVNPNNETRQAVPVQYPETWPLPNKDRIWDEHKGAYVDIGVVDRIVTAGGVAQPKYRKLTSFPKANNGMVYCSAGNVADEEVYEFFELTDHNASKPNRDQSKPAFFERVDVQGDSKQRNRKRDALTDALVYARNMTNGDIREFAAAQNWDERTDVEILRDKIGEWIEKDPAGFIKAVENESRGDMALIKNAITAGKIAYDPVQHRIVNASNQQTLMKLDRVEGVDYLAQVADWLKTSRNGDNVLKGIKKLMKQEDHTDPQPV